MPDIRTTAEVEALIEALSPSSDPLARATMALAVWASARRVADDQVSEARRQGRTWDEVGVALGVSRQTAHERFRNSAHHGPYARSNRVNGAPSSTDAVPCP